MKKVIFDKEKEFSIVNTSKKDEKLTISDDKEVVIWVDIEDNISYIFNEKS